MTPYTSKIRIDLRTQQEATGAYDTSPVTDDTSGKPIYARVAESPQYFQPLQPPNGVVNTNYPEYRRDNVINYTSSPTSYHNSPINSGSERPHQPFQQPHQQYFPNNPFRQQPTS